MRRSRRDKTRLRTWVLVAFGVLVGTLLAGCVFLCVLVSNVPAWYRPPHVPASEHQRVRDSIVDAVSRFSDDLVAGVPFEVSLSDRQLSEWIAVRAEVWPESEEWVPDFLQDPVIAFDTDRLILAARAVKDEWDAVVSAHLTFAIDGDTITTRLNEVAGGSLPLPTSAVADRLELALTAADQDVDAMPDGIADVVRFFRARGAVRPLQNGVTTENRFRWQNGRRWFRIDDLRLEPGRLWMRIEPLSTGLPPGRGDPYSPRPVD